MQIISGVALLLSYFITIIGVTYGRPFSLYISGFLYLLAFKAIIASFGVATTLSKFG